MKYLNPIAQILKSKGVGPEGSRSLNSEQMLELETHLPSPEIPLCTKSTLLVAFLLLPNTPEEERWLKSTLAQGLWPEECRWFWDLKLALPQGVLPQALRLALAGAELSASMARSAFAEILQQSQPEWMGGAFLEAMRLKRETFGENLAFWQEMLSSARHQSVDLPRLLDLADAYDGLSRSPLLSVAVAVLLAEMGYAVVLHGARQIAPKCGLCAHDVLKELGMDPCQSLEEAALRLENPALGWAYVDQEVYFPELNALKGLRRDMVKRPFIATFEKMLLPLRAKSNQMVIGYTHTAYRPLLEKLMAEMKMCHSFAVVRGAEGTSRPSTARVALMAAQRNKEVLGDTWDPGIWGFALEEESIYKGDSVQMAADLRELLAGGAGPWVEQVLLHAAFVLDVIYGECSSDKIAQMRALLGSAQLLERLR